MTAPPPIIYLNVDIGAEGVVGKFQEQGKQVLIYDVRVPKEATTKSDIWTTMWSEFKARVRKVYALKSGTVVWDTATEVYELARLSHFGRLTEVKPSDYSVVNNEWREVLRVAYDSPLNTIFIHKMKAIWRVLTTSSGKTQLTKTKDFELSGFTEMDYLSQINLITYREDSQEGSGMPDFSVFIKDCRHNPSLNGTILRGPMCDFGFLLNLVHAK